jgi:FkbM family methyltransferase
MSIVKTAFRGTLEKLGYRINRINIPADDSLPRERTVVNAYYRGRCFKCFAGDYIGDSILTGKGWDNQLEPILDRLVSLVSRGDVVEVGANIGASLLPIASKYPSFTFHCVEPVPEFFTLLEQNAASFGPANVRLYNRALAAVDGASIEIHKQVGTAGAVAQYWNHVPMGSINLQATTLDALCRDLKVVFVKLDVDGYESEILKGAAETFARFHPACFLELAPKLMEMIGVHPADLTDFFRHQSYDLIEIYHDGKHIKTTRSFAELIEIADSVPYYVDVLIEKSSK